MKKFLLAFLIFFSGINYTQQQVDIPWPSLANSDWPMIAGNPQFTGRSPNAGPKTETVLWTLDLPYGIFSGPVIGEDGTLYVGTAAYLGFIGDTSNYFYAIDPRDGKIKWTFVTDTPYANASGMVVNNEGTVFFGDTNTGWMYALDPDGNLVWKNNFGAGVLWLMNIDLQGNLYITNSSHNLISFSKEGELNWAVNYGGGFGLSSPTFSPDGNTIYISGRDSNLYALNLDGSIKWIFKYSGTSIAPITIDNAGNIYFFYRRKLVSMDSTGVINWTYVINDSNAMNYAASIAIDYSGNLYYFYNTRTGTRYGRIESVDYNGNYRWTYQFEYPGEMILQPLVVDKNGTIYCGSTYGYYYYAISDRGKLLWRLPLNGYEVDQTTAIASDGTLYIGVHRQSWNVTQVKTLIAIRDTGIVSVSDPISVIEDYSLSQNYPNPFNPSTVIGYQLPVSGNVTLKVFNVLGREVTTLVNEYKEAGKHSVEFDAAGLPSGVYFYRLNADSFSETKKMILLR